MMLVVMVIMVAMVTMVVMVTTAAMDTNTTKYQTVTDLQCNLDEGTDQCRPRPPGRSR